jgi:hypothetical protein
MSLAFNDLRGMSAEEEQGLFSWVFGNACEVETAACHRNNITTYSTLEIE